MTMPSQPLISIIVPVYNVERYLDQCMQSLVCQTYANLEIIMVDDGSTDSSGEKCDTWAERLMPVLQQPAIQVLMPPPECISVLWILMTMCCLTCSEH